MPNHATHRRTAPRHRSLRAASFLLGTSVLTHAAWAQTGQDRSVLPVPPAPFAGTVDADRDKAKAVWPVPVKAPQGAPNVILVLLDDVGFGASSVTGGPIHAPALEQLAKRGLLYDNFHVNSLCSPTRGALLSGRNDHEIGFGHVTENANGFPGYDSVWPHSAASIARVLRDNGYSTAAWGKWHNTPFWEVGPAGPFEHWPTNLGFEYFYGFMAAADNQFEPRLYRDTVPVEPPARAEDGYYVTTDLATDAIHWLHQHNAVAPNKPFFVYFATGATHEPHQVPQIWVDKYKGQFDGGWDKLREQTFAREKAHGIIPANAELTPRPTELPAWDSLPPDTKRLLAHQAEVYAGFLEQADHEVGRILDAVRQEGVADNTLVLYIVGDNGASGEGGLDGHDAADALSRPRSINERLAIADHLGSDLYFNHYSAAWAWGLDAPFQWMKQVASHLGGTTDPLIAVWPARIADRGAVRTQFGHVTDIAPTIYAAAGITPPETVDGVKQLPLEGVSLLPSFADANAPSEHHVQYFEMMGNRGIYKDGWWAGARHLLPWEQSKSETTSIGQHPWELYHIAEDYSQAHDLAAREPEKLKEMEALFDSEARRNNVYPLSPRAGQIFSIATGRTHVDLSPDNARLTQQQIPSLRGRNFTLRAEIDVPEGGGQGVLLADGGHFGGTVLYVKDGVPVFESTAAGSTAGRIAGADKLPAGHDEVVVTVTPQVDATRLDVSSRTIFGAKPAPAHAEIAVNGRTVAAGDLQNVSNIYGETLDVGRDLGSPVSLAYTPPAPFTGTIRKVTLDLR